MDDERLDLSAIAPYEGRRFDEAVRNVLRGAAVAEPSLESVLVRQGRAAIALLGVVALSAWVPVWLGGDVAPARDRVSKRTVTELVAQWAHADTVPDGVDVGHVLGVFDE